MQDELQKLAIIAMDARQVGAIRTEIGWVWRSDLFFSRDAAEAVAKAMLANPLSGGRTVDSMESEKDRDIAALDREIAGLLPESE